MVGTSQYVGGLLDPRGGSVQPLDLARELARVASEAGAQIFTQSLVRRLAPNGNRWMLDCAHGNVLADQVIVATNGYSDGLVPNLARSLLPVNSFQIATDPLNPTVADQILKGGQAAYDSRRLILYFRKSPDGRMVLGGRASFSSAKKRMSSLSAIRFWRTNATGVGPAEIR